MYTFLQRYWFHLDSLLRNPRRLSAAQLESYVVQLASDGYTVYVVAGVFPKGVTQQVRDNDYHTVLTMTTHSSNNDYQYTQY